ncbi:hypothetical protein RB195_005041 [Necator americanus]|uniref:Uncharacterized protein n=1 Tax=Necator americanus TaxID=51031 RepID=A0ABR1BP83_NECAM
MTACNLLTLRDFTRVTDYHLAGACNKVQGRIRRMADRGLVWKERLCPDRGSHVKVAKQANVNSLHKG